MAYNDNLADYWKSTLTVENLPVTFLRLADAYRNRLDELGPDVRETIEFIIDNLLVEGAETVTLAGGDGVGIGSQPATVGQVVGTADLTGGFDWTTTPQTLTIDSTSVNLDTETTDLATTVTEVNDALSLAGVTTVEAFSDGSSVGLRTVGTGAGESFTIETSDGASTLGVATGTYTGTDAVSATETEFSPNFGNVGVGESYFVVRVDGSIASSKVVSRSPLKIRVAGDVTGATEVVVDATNPFTFEEYYGGSKPLIDSTN